MRSNPPPKEEAQMGMLKNILHVDDDPDIREIALIALETVSGFSVVQCS